MFTGVLVSFRECKVVSAFDVRSPQVTLQIFAPWKINMQPKNHPFRKEHDLPNLHDYLGCKVV